MRTPLHIATVDRPAPDATALVALCGLTYAQREPTTGEVWHAALACAPAQFPTWERVWGQRAGATAGVCPRAAGSTTPSDTARLSAGQGKGTLMMIEIATSGAFFTGYCQLPPGTEPGAPEFNAIAHHLHCDVDDLTWTGEEAITEPDQTHTEQEYEDWQAALRAHEVLWRIKGLWATVTPPHHPTPPACVRAKERTHHDHTLYGPLPRQCRAWRTLSDSARHCGSRQHPPHGVC